MIPSHLSVSSTVSTYSVDLDCDVGIVGAGMVGSTLAVALGQAGIRVALIESRDLGQGVGPDGRASALALGTARILERLGVWPLMQSWGVSPIHRIQVSDGESPLVAQLRREMIQAPALGYIVENQITQKALLQRIRECPSVTVLSPAQVQGFSARPDHMQVELSQEGSRHTLRTAVLVGADGARSQLREWAGIPVSRWGYGQVCIVSTLTHELPHAQVAYERFQPSGPFAILPTPDPHRSCVVWTARQSDRERLMSLPEEEFLQAIQPSFGSQLGALLAASPRACYEPQRSHAQTYIGSRLALVGDAAHTTHPVGGQGVNLGMRDVAALTALLIEAKTTGRDPGAPALLQAYERCRRPENELVLFGTDTANRLFSNRNGLLLILRRLGLWSLDSLPLLKPALMRQAMGIRPQQPQLQQLPSLSHPEPLPTPV
ncbi:UbiH/UbiF/VisC/COQ6 family ubiquinone biosynthesis hydroxylase [Thermostichus vulcanus]|uniref:UbiH/UbiF/VisC/COQ6 family ubiquinone biosynthesis hydroxylase n=1 Tax=Thermostichus vulcanus str. 'Rupite' TaxID=2813851 RepID=A0ABT0C8H0_THEVL|nr:UbiH/UbiF/VisC/COQ6 family ubiquinone biosynthesis hydroxylase [Thermostichus vulcanus]MCJ2542083.1 UbiH/UbiF/VisC/COQ6 family ubiquinone biosynthesis hydroxylase [Thermostichus vulcanus str. 'Rupite']